MNAPLRAREVPYYQPAADECELFVTAQANGLPLLLKGPTGCGKTRFVEPHGGAAEPAALYGCLP